ncbi:hypothetical protein S170810_238 [Synechococcus phage S-CAM1]|uniref:Uncharacterized protein n=1 Tax=Synechococcus phage S-CAM1 TaxID=754037 RepID=A0A1D8KGE3_9CAUD|nr:hypothetical protein N330309_238 [Synechococcus phage S-CAM1]AOV57740.1 hypothetical protein N170310_238 [Synechococcus phage S-CAM1]AOV57990.1 hypothetical protein C030809_238 [Synechococcus phage S-CAM1]AOV58240.1 hypothetical protein S170810_238 [Synechococcus phage S-CAM1]
MSNAKTKAEKKKLLLQYNTNALRALLIANFDESIVSMLPPGEVPYTVNDAPEGTEHSVLEKEYRKLYLFFKGGSSTLKQSRREELFIQMLEGLTAGEAEVLTLVKDKKLGKRWKITKAVVSEAFPHIQWGNRG